MDENFKFPIYFKNPKTLDYFRYSDGNKVLQFSPHSINRHCGPYLFQDKKEFYLFINTLMKRTDLIQIEPEEFNETLEATIIDILTRGVEPMEYWNHDQINLNKKLLKIRYGF